MKPLSTPRIALLASQLAEALMTAALCAGEIRDAVLADLGDEAASRLSPARSDRQQRPLLDETTMCVVWNGVTLHLGHTVAFRLLNRLARRPNQYVAHHDLLQDVWHGDSRAITTIRSSVRHLQGKLRAGGMTELAAAIRGHNGHYILEL